MDTELVILEPIEPQDDRRLSRFIELDGDIRALAAETGESIPALYCWLTRPHIAAYLAFYRQLKAQHLRDAALSMLLRTAAASKDPAEQRRAAIAILRAIAPATARPQLSITEPAAGTGAAHGHTAAASAAPSAGRASDRSSLDPRPHHPSPPHRPGRPPIRCDQGQDGSPGLPAPGSAFEQPPALVPLGMSGRQPTPRSPRPTDSG